MNAEIISSAIDWNQIWKETIKQHKMIVNSTFKNDDKRYCKCYSYLNHRWDNSIGVEKEIQKIPFQSNFKVLDIGAGPGTHAIPLSKQVKQITAIEPSQPMIDCLIQRIKENKVNNLKYINKRWEDIDIDQDLDPPYNLVLASFSLIIDDIKKAIIKMMRVSSDYIYLIWHIGVPAWEKVYVQLWKSLFKIPYTTVPKANCLFNILNQMNIYPNIETYTMDNYYKFKTKQEAFRHFNNELVLSKKNQRELLSSYLEKNLIKENGNFVLDGSSNYAVIWWRKNKKHMPEIIV